MITVLGFKVVKVLAIKKETMKKANANTEK
jgi:hypothetical protein